MCKPMKNEAITTVLRKIWPSKRFFAFCFSPIFDYISYLSFISGEKIYQKEANLIPVNYPVTWSQFYKQPIYSHSKKKYTFWAWFYAAMKLTHEYLVDAWNAGFIAGFVSKDRVDQLLLTRPHGTFLLRFSETVLGKLVKHCLQ